MQNISANQTAPSHAAPSDELPAALFGNQMQLEGG